MKYSDQIKPVSYLKANTAEILRRMNERREPLVITQNGVAKLSFKMSPRTSKRRKQWRC